MSEIKQSLLGFGILLDTLPLTGDGQLIDDDFKAYMTQQKVLDEKIKEQIGSSEASNIVKCPTEKDVLLGRGRPYQDFPGVLRLHELVETTRPTYKDKPKSEKTQAVINIVCKINEEGGRFLRRLSLSGDGDDNSNGNGNPPERPSWEVVDFATAHRKVSNCFQTPKRRPIRGVSCPSLAASEKSEAVEETATYATNVPPEASMEEDGGGTTSAEDEGGEDEDEDSTDHSLPLGT